MQHFFLVQQLIVSSLRLQLKYSLLSWYANRQIIVVLVKADKSTWMRLDNFDNTLQIVKLAPKYSFEFIFPRPHNGLIAKIHPLHIPSILSCQGRIYWVNGTWVSIICLQLQTRRWKTRNNQTDIIHHLKKHTVRVYSVDMNESVSLLSHREQVDGSR